MSRITASVPLALLVTSPLLLPVPARAEATPQPVPPSPNIPLPITWTEPPEAVRSAVVALRNACAIWPQQVPRSPDATPAPVQRVQPGGAVVCDAVLHPNGDRLEWLILGALLGAALVGTAVGAYATVSTLLRMLGNGLRRVAGAIWDLRSRRRPGWQE